MDQTVFRRPYPGSSHLRAREVASGHPCGDIRPHATYPSAPGPLAYDYWLRDSERWRHQLTRIRSLSVCMALHSCAPGGSSSIRRMTKIRDIVLSSLNLSKQRGSHFGDNKLSTTRRLTESLKKPFQPRSERAGPSAEGRGESPPKRRRTGPIEDDVIVIGDSGVVSSPSKSVSQRNNSGHGAMTEIEAGKVGRDERTLDPRTVLKPFRVDQKILA